MKIFNNFDTKFCNKVLSKKKEESGDNNVIIIKRSKYFWYFTWVVPLIIITLIFSFILYLFLRYNLPNSFIYLLFIIFVILTWKFVLNKYLRYKLDFTIVSPKWIFSYKQKWFLNSNFKEISSNKIKTIQVSNDKLLWNIFKYWVLEIISDWAELENFKTETSGMIRLAYVDSHYQIKEKISKICF